MKGTLQEESFAFPFLWPQLPLSYLRLTETIRPQAFFVFNPTHLMSTVPRSHAGSHAVARDRKKSGFSAVYVLVNLLRFIVNCGEKMIRLR